MPCVPCVYNSTTTQGLEHGSDLDPDLIEDLDDEIAGGAEVGVEGGVEGNGGAAEGGGAEGGANKARPQRATRDPNATRDPTAVPRPKAAAPRASRAKDPDAKAKTGPKPGKAKELANNNDDKMKKLQEGKCLTSQHLT